MFPKFQDLSDITDANSLNSLSSKLESLDFVNNPVIVNGGQLKVKQGSLLFPKIEFFIKGDI